MGVSLPPVDWSLALGHWGDLAAGLDDVSQCVGVILTTPLRSDPHRPDFGCDLQPWIDRPVSEAAAGIVAAVRDALDKWEHRISVIAVTVVPSEAGLRVMVRWQLIGSIGVDRTTTIGIGEVRS